MVRKLSDQLWELRYAIDEALSNSERITAAIAALEHPGRDVEFVIDLALVDHSGPAARPQVVTQGQGMLMLNATDILFLKALKISAETGVAEP